MYPAPKGPKWCILVRERLRHFWAQDDDARMFQILAVNPACGLAAYALVFSITTCSEPDQTCADFSFANTELRLAAE